MVGTQRGGRRRRSGLLGGDGSDGGYSDRIGFGPTESYSTCGKG